ncbi:MAG TPA: DOMON-like domain-containing protein, partial [Allosphingosinicella sp.]|nr:DOMON-like domain-containing protein [Allosphingosinicella sp.]
VEVSRPKSGGLALCYSVTGDLEALSLPPMGESVRAGDLWQHSCFEAFRGMAEGYLEYNFAPSTAWAAYRFDDYRAGMRDADIAPPRIETRIEPGRFDLSVELALPGEGPLGLSAVIEERSGRKSWWALAHPPGDPDFHHPDCFALELPAADAP